MVDELLGSLDAFKLLDYIHDFSHLPCCQARVDRDGDHLIRKIPSVLE